MVLGTDILFEWAERFSKTASELGRDFQQGLETARRRDLLISSDTSTFNETSTLQEAYHDTTIAGAMRQRHDSGQDNVEIEPHTPASMGLGIGSEGPVCAWNAAPSKPPEEGCIPTVLSSNDVLLGTTAGFANTDLQIAEVYLKQLNQGEVSPESQEHIANRCEEIRMRLALKRHNQPRNTKEAVAESIEITNISARLAETILREETRDLSAPESSTHGIIQSRLHAGKLLNNRIRLCLLALLRSLVWQLSCCKEKHFIRLKLTGFVNPVDHKSRPFFDLYLSNGHYCARSSWVESRCFFEREILQRQDKGCEHIKTSILAKKKLEIFLGDTLIHNGSAPREVQEGPSSIRLKVAEEFSSSITPVVHLANLLEQDDTGYEAPQVSNAKTFSANERDHLCLNLALSLLQLCGRAWRRVIWYPDDPDSEIGIFFLRDPSTQEVVDITQPYLSWRLQDEPSNETSSEGLRCDSQLLDFARLLIEIHTWKRLRNPKPQRSEEQSYGPSTCSKEQIRQQLLHNISNTFRQVDHYFTLALEACLNDAGRNEAQVEDKPERIQAYVFEKIVKPLHMYLGNPELPLSALQIMHHSDQDVSKSPDQPDNSMSLYDLTLNDNEPREEMPRSGGDDNFWSKMERLKVYTQFPVNSKQPVEDDPWHGENVRIAIIDSGIRDDHAQIIAAKQLQIRQCRNFTSMDPEDCQDLIGHGTMVTQLLLKVAPMSAEFYIAKVTDQKKMPKSQLYRISEAVKWAVMEWDVHIISISLAFSGEHYDVNEELTQAISPSFPDGKGRIVFAAAGNQAGYTPLAWPACKKGVIAVYSTDRSGNGTETTPNPAGELNLATLGDNIKMRWPDPKNHGRYMDVYISGSSFATPIAAGIAAIVLDCSRHDRKLNQYTKDKLCSHDRMKKVLKAMSYKRKGYDFLHPLTFFEEVFRGGIYLGLRLPLNNYGNIHEVLRYITLVYD